MIQLQTKYHSQIGVEERLKLTPYRHSGLVPRDTTAETQRPSAIIWALLYFIQTKCDANLHLHCDPLSVLQSTQGLWHYRIDDPPLLRARATYMFVWTFLQDKLSLQHVKGHAGNYGNELADVVAGAIREGSLQGRIPSINLAKWYHGETPSIVRAWTQIDADIRTGQVMACDQGHLLWQHTDPPMANLQWDSWRQDLARCSKVTVIGSLSGSRLDSPYRPLTVPL